MAQGITIDQLATLDLSDATTNDLIVVYDNETGTTRKLILGSLASRMASIGGYSLGAGNSNIVDSWTTSATADGTDIELNCGTLADISVIQGTVAATDILDDYVNVYSFKYKIDSGNPVLIGFEWDATHTSMGDTPGIISAADVAGDLVISFETANTGRTLNLSYASVMLT